MAKLSNFSSQLPWLLLIISLAAILRLTGLNWDQGQHPHPDERFLIMVTQKISWPQTFSQYLNPTTSPLNPYNQNYDFYVYGHLPLTGLKLLSLITNLDNYQQLTLLGRSLSAILDLITVFLIYKLGLILGVQLDLKQSRIRLLALLSALAYALSPLAVQLSHFFATDAWVTLFILASFYFLLRIHHNRDTHTCPNFWLLLLASSLSMAVALGSKLNSVLALPFLLAILATSQLRKVDLAKKKWLKIVLTVAGTSAVFSLVVYLGLRLFDPYLWQNPLLFSFQLSKQFIKNLTQLKSWSNPDIWFPPSVQWIKTQPFIFSTKNLIGYSWGVIASLFALTGGIRLIKNIKKISLPLIIFFVWMAAVFTYQSFQFSKNARYLWMIFPGLSLLTGLGILTLHAWIKRATNISAKLSLSLLIFLLSIWPLSFFQIYLKPHSRVQASRWIYQTVPQKSIILSEHWDDALPLALDQDNPLNHRYQIDELPVFAPDNQKKKEIIFRKLAQADYYILSSNRAWRSISQNPEKYPWMSQIYKLLLANKLEGEWQGKKFNYQLIARFSSYPGLGYLGIPIQLNDDWVEESLSVYDHPQVLIYANLAKSR